MFHRVRERTARLFGNSNIVGSPTDISRSGPRELAAARNASRNFFLGELLGILFLLGGAGGLLAASWRKWNDPIIDFGRELYTPWRLAEGEILYRDVQSVYGPLSQCLNAILFKIFGPGIMVLVGANALVFLAILGVAYLLFRRAWGWAGAWSACAVFVAVFAFSRFLPVANFNYVAPYAHEVTHGMLAVLGLTLAALRWIECPTPQQSMVVGLLFGITLLIKPEFILGGGATLGAALALGFVRRRSFSLAMLAWIAGGAIIPTLLLLGYFRRAMPWAEAAQSATNAWWGTLTNSISGMPYQQGMMGLDQPFFHLKEHLLATLLGLAVIGGIFFWMRFFAGMKARWAWWPGVAVIASAAVILGAQIEWIHAGRSLLGLTLAYFAVVMIRLWRCFRGKTETEMTRRLPTQVLLTVLAVAMMARMFLHGRIWQFGFFQAALAGMVVTAVIVGELPVVVSLERRSRWMTALVFGLWLGTGVVALTKVSWQWLSRVTFEVGSGRDLFRSFPPQLDGHGDTVRQLVDALGAFSPKTPLLVLPEGLMINYLARMRSPLPYFQYYAFTTEQGKEAAIVEKLEKAPPELVALISRDLREFGIERYGQKSGEGLEILSWVQANYVVIRRIYDDPLDPARCGAILLRHRSAVLRDEPPRN